MRDLSKQFPFFSFLFLFLFFLQLKLIEMTEKTAIGEEFDLV